MLRTNFISSYNLYFLAHRNGLNTKHIDISHSDSPSGKAPVIVINSDAGDNGRLLSVPFFFRGELSFKRTRMLVKKNLKRTSKRNNFLGVA